MISKRLYINIIIRVILIVLISLLLGYFILEKQSVRHAIICLIAVTALTISLILYLNRTNRNIKYFFDSVRNDDSSLSFPVDIKIRSLRELNMSMNNVNSQIQQLKIDIRNQEQYFRKILEHLAAGILTYDKKGFIHHANSAAKRVLSLEVLTHLSQLERIDTRLYAAINNQKPAERSLVTTKTDQGEIQLLLRSTSFGSDENEMTILSIQDIKHELDEKEVDAWMKLIRVLMHEIMNSIAPITSLSESLSGIYRLDEKPISPELVTSKTISTTLQGLNVINEQGKGLMTFVESYRKLSGIPEPERSSFRVSDLLDRIRILYHSIDRSESTEMQTHLREPDLKIFADQNLISQVLINLLKNALDANENNPEGKIMIHSGTGSDNCPEICVADNGPGIPEENLEKIFVPFFTTRETGSGIGLSISRQIMRMHGGTLKVSSVPNRETSFCLSFPC